MLPLFRRFPAIISQGLTTLRPTIFLFAVDTLANLIDYSFHVFLGRKLVPSDFAVFQTVNSLLLIAVTAFGVMQPVMARFVAEREASSLDRGRLSQDSRVLFRSYLGWSALVGLVVSVTLWVLAGRLSILFNLPEYAIRFGVAVVFLILLRPVVAGTLQGAQRFIPFGVTRIAYAVGRFAFAAAALGLGFGLKGAVVSLPIGQLLAVVIGLVFLGSAVWRQPAQESDRPEFGRGLRLAGWAFLAYGAFTGMQNLDLLWVNRHFSRNAAGAYAAAVLLRRVLILFPAAAAVVMFPRIAERVARKLLPDRLLGWTFLFVSGSVLVPVGLYLYMGPEIVALVFGPGYEAAGVLLGTMGVAMLGYGMAAIWLNLYLATRPAIFVGFLVAMTFVQAGGFSLWHGSPAEIALVFAVTGWLPSVAGLWIYLMHLRPLLQKEMADV